jgi:hypothetical protein
MNPLCVSQVSEWLEAIEAIEAIHKSQRKSFIILSVSPQQSYRLVHYQQTNLRCSGGYEAYHEHVS